MDIIVRITKNDSENYFRNFRESKDVIVLKRGIGGGPNFTRVVETFTAFIINNVDLEEVRNGILSEIGKQLFKSFIKATSKLVSSKEKEVVRKIIEYPSLVVNGSYNNNQFEFKIIFFLLFAKVKDLDDSMLLVETKLLELKKLLSLLNNMKLSNVGISLYWNEDVRQWEIEEIVNYNLLNERVYRRQ